MNAINTGDKWKDLFWELAIELKCLPSSFVDGNQHVFRTVDDLRAQLKEAELAECRAKTRAMRLEMELAASQANEVHLREALESMCHEFRGHDLPYGSKAYANATTLLNRFLTPDTTALDAMIQKAGEVMRERCANGCEKEAVQIVIDGLEERAYNCAVADCAAAIRALPGVTLDDLK